MKIATKKIKKGLNNLESIIKGEPKILYEFSKYVASKLKGDLTAPDEFSKLWKSALNELRELQFGPKDSGSGYAYCFTYLQVACAAISGSIYLFTENICGKEFAKIVKKTYEPRALDIIITQYMAIAR